MSSPTVEVKVRPILSDMPFNIKSMIAENTDIRTRYTLRKVSTHFRAAVDFSKYTIKYSGIERIRNRNDAVMVTLTEIQIKYEKNGDDGCIIRTRNGRNKQIEGEDYFQRAMNDFLIILKSPLVHLTALRLSDVSRQLVVPINATFQEKIATFRHKLSVEHLLCGFNQDKDEVLRFLRHLKPGVLKTLQAGLIHGNCSEIVDIEHWPFLEEAWVADAGGLPISKFLHLKRFTTRNFTMTKDVVKEIVQSFLQHPDKFEKYKFCTSDRNLYPIWKAAISEYFPGRNLSRLRHCANTRIPIPRTDHLLKILITDWNGLTITFEKIRSEE